MCVLRMCLTWWEVDKESVYVCVGVGKGEGVTIVCACFTEPLWQRGRQKEGRANAVALYERAVCELMWVYEEGMINPLEKRRAISKNSAKKRDNSEMARKGHEPFLSLLWIL